MSRDTLETIATHIFDLDEALLDEYRQDGYDADHLQPGMRVWLDGDLFKTAEEVADEIHGQVELLREGTWTDEEARRDRLEELQEVLRRLRGVV